MNDRTIVLAEKIAARLIARKETVAVAEGSAGGLISAALLSVPGRATAATTCRRLRCGRWRFSPSSWVKLTARRLGYRYEFISKDGCGLYAHRQSIALAGGGSPGFPVRRCVEDASHRTQHGS